MRKLVDHQILLALITFLLRRSECVYATTRLLTTAAATASEMQRTRRRATPAHAATATGPGPSGPITGRARPTAAAASRRGGVTVWAGSGAAGRTPRRRPAREPAVPSTARGHSGPITEAVRPSAGWGRSRGRDAATIQSRVISELRRSDDVDAIYF